MKPVGHGWWVSHLLVMVGDGEPLLLDMAGGSVVFLLGMAGDCGWAAAISHGWWVLLLL